MCIVFSIEVVVHVEGIVDAAVAMVDVAGRCSVVSDVAISCCGLV